MEESFEKTGRVYRICDVFTETPLQGNPLAVFEDGTGLSDARMQAIAKEINLSETTFVFPQPDAIERERGVRVRIFTTTEELPFAGHPTLGTATLLRSFHPRLKGASEIVLDLKAGRVPVRFDAARSRNRASFGTMVQPDPVFGKVHDPALVAAAVGLSQDDIVSTTPIQTVSTGNPFCIVVLHSLEALSQLQLPLRESAAYLATTDARFFYFISRVPGEQAQWRARMQFNGGEDPGTGSAAGCAIAYLVRYGVVVSGEQIHLRQGVEIGRPSDLFLSAELTSSSVRRVEVGGSTVPVAEGLFFLE